MSRVTVFIDMDDAWPPLSKEQLARYWAIFKRLGNVLWPNIEKAGEEFPALKLFPEALYKASAALVRLDFDRGLNERQMRAEIRRDKAMPLRLAGLAFTILSQADHIG